MSGKTGIKISKGAQGSCVLYEKFLETTVKYNNDLIKLLSDQGKTIEEIRAMEASGNQSQQMVIGKDVICTMTTDELVKDIKENDIASGNYRLSNEHDNCTGTLYKVK